jgi:large subunit ribosomal protein L4
MKVDLYNIKGEVVGQEDFNTITVNPALIHQVVVSQMANRRRVIASVKDRGDVSGGGKKPWRQKGTGRARHGSNRSPIWRGGGVTFGPSKEKNYSKIIPVKMKRKALEMVLSAKADKKLLFFLENNTPQKTKEMDQIWKALPCNGRSTLFAWISNNPDLIRTTKNLEKAGTIAYKDLNALDAMSFKYLVIVK